MWQQPQRQKLTHLRDVVDVIRGHMRHQAEEAGGQTSSEPPSKNTDLALDLDSAPQRPAASAPSRLGPANSSARAGESVQPHDFERETCWVGNLRVEDASEEKLKAIFGKRCGMIRSMVVRQKPDNETPGSILGKSWALVTFLQPDGRDRAVAATGSLLGTSGYPVKVELLCLDDAFNSDGELKTVWKHAKEKAKETTSWDRSQTTQLASPRPKRRRHSTPATLSDDAVGGGDFESEANPGTGQMARALRRAGRIDDISEVTKENFLAKGTSGAVFRAQWNGMTVAAKFFTMMDDPKVMEAFRQELEVMRSLQHTNLLRVYGYCMNPSSPCLVTELMYGSLDQLLWGRQASIAPTLHERQQLKIMDGIAAGIAFLHKNGVLYNRDLTMKLCDFAFSKWKQAGTAQVMSSAVGTPAWMAPEILRGGEYNFKADVYSYGVILWEVLARRQPFKELNAFAISYQVGTQGRLLSIAEIEGAGPGAVATSEVVGKAPTAESSRTQQPSGSSGHSPQSASGSDTWWKTLLRDCFREACDRPTLDRVIGTLRDALAKSRPTAAPRVATQARGTQKHAAATHSGAPATRPQSEPIVTTVGTLGQSEATP